METQILAIRGWQTAGALSIWVPPKVLGLILPLRHFLQPDPNLSHEPVRLPAVRRGLLPPRVGPARWLILELGSDLEANVARALAGCTTTEIVGLNP